MSTECGTWFTERIPKGWFTGAPTVYVDREEIVVVGPISGEPAQFREDTRDARVGIAAEAERRFGRKVSWGVPEMACKESRAAFRQKRMARGNSVSRSRNCTMALGEMCPCRWRYISKVC